MSNLATRVRQHADRYDTGDDTDAQDHATLTAAAAILARDLPDEPRNPLGKAGPRTRPGLPSIGDVDERNHPDWPAIRLRADRAPQCTNERTAYGRTRCSDETCHRCWMGGPANWPSLQTQP